MDPRQNHPGHDPSMPPPRRDPPGIPSRHIPVKEKAPTSMRPTPEMWLAAKRWTPAGIASALLVVFFAIGGHDGVSKLVEASSQAKSLKTEIQGLRADLALEREERAKVMARLHATEKNLSSLCDFVADMNGGRPNPTWCSADSRSIRVDTKQNPPPFKTTGESWVYVP